MAFRANTILLLSCAALVVPAAAGASDGERYDPYAKTSRGVHRFDMRDVLRDRAGHVSEPVEQPDLSRLRDSPAPRSAPPPPRQMPAGWVQLGEVVQREEIAFGLKEIDPEPSPAWEDVEGNQYPRKGTVFLNFNGGMLKSGDDNSAESKSTLAIHNHPYPVFAYGETTALALIQAVKTDLETLGVRTVYAKRPNKTVPYTMAMVGGDWEDTNLSDPAGGVAPGTDCEDRDQRNVVYAFGNPNSATISQEIAHAWGLDHTLGSDRIMSYQGGLNKKFGDNCQPLCEEACQGPNSIGCRKIHEIYCGVGSETQNDLAELAKIYGTTEPDTEPPMVAITAPTDADTFELPVGSDVEVKGEIHDNYGGVGWKLIVSKDGEVIFDQVDYDRYSAWFFSNLPKGEYEVILEAEDHADHIVQDKLILYVGIEGDPTTGAGTGDETGDGSSGGSGETGSDSGSGDEETGCGCRSSRGDASGALGLPLLGLLWAARARRRRR